MNALRRAHRSAGAFARKSPLRLGVFALLALFATWPLLVDAPALNDFRDAHVLSHYETAASISVRKHGEAPLWDPYYCGGMYLLGTPQARFISPTFLFTLVFGEERGASLAAFAMLIVGLEGAFRYARSRRATHLAAFLAAPVFGLSGVFAVAPVFGWTNFYGFALLPWIALGMRKALRGEALGVALVAGAVAWCVGFGGTYAAPMAALWCALEIAEALGASLRSPRDMATLLGRSALVGCLALALSAVRVWPILETLRDAPRVIGGAPANDGLTLAKMLFVGIAPGFNESSDGTYFVGVLALPAIALACFGWRSVPLVVHAASWALLAVGYALKPSLFGGLRSLPVYGTLRYPERFLILATLALSALAARGITIATARARIGGRARIVWALGAVAASLCLVAGVPVMIAQHHHAATRRELTAPPVAVDRPFHQARGTRWALAYYAPMNRGSLSCWDAYPVPQSPLLRGDLESEESLEDPRAGTMIERSWSPNRIDLDVDLARPTRILVNQNWHVGWRTNVGEVKRERGLLVVDVPAGQHRVTLRFLPRSAIGGALVSLAALVSIGFLLRRKRSRIILQAVAAMAPAVVLVCTLVLVPQARAEPLPPATSSGDPIVRYEIPEGSPRIDVRFEGGITLESALLDGPLPEAGGTVSLELDWRREAKLAHGVGIFMHIEPSKGDALRGDHPLISQVLSFDDAPAGKTLRDVLPLTLPLDAHGTTWKVWVGLWRIQEGDRLHVRDSGGATVEDDRVLVTTFDVP